MGHRHNRKRTRSRPRNRNRNNTQPPANQFPEVLEPPVPTLCYHSRTSSTVSSTSSAFAPPPVPTIPSAYHVTPLSAHHPAAHRSISCWDENFASWQHRVKQGQQDDETHLRRMFGGEDGEDEELCEGMLDVVRGLFDGETDFGYT